MRGEVGEGRSLTIRDQIEDQVYLGSSVASQHLQHLAIRERVRVHPLELRLDVSNDRRDCLQRLSKKMVSYMSLDSVFLGKPQKRQ